MIKDDELFSIRCFHRDGHIPARYQVLVDDPSLQALALIDSNEQTVLGFSGRRKRPDFHLRFPTRPHADSFVAHWLNGLRERAEASKTRRQHCMQARNPLAVGDVLCEASGIPTERVAYYEVTQCIGACTVEIRELCRVEERDCCDTSGSCAPVPGCYVGPPMRRRVSEDGRVRIGRSGPWAERKAVHRVAGMQVYSSDTWERGPGSRG
ncbi:hypothetical protein [Chitinasiproducens palmae]|uniref:Uncharacterized protein n=1 Tax=Chitinasiproducens palmae TaxID=1770053 RepID=A0A1H2PR03_9BURK|nr:hypothetical protein [Chitinasiproducens palmae]SDV48885.1 hypothetical protein SAMN05216551_106141 [Chitinasiproducens palmae]